MESARISVDLKEFEEEIAKARIQGCLSGQQNVADIIKHFMDGNTKGPELPEKMNASLKQHLVDIIKVLEENFAPDGEEG